MRDLQGSRQRILKNSLKWIRISFYFGPKGRKPRLARGFWARTPGAPEEESQGPPPSGTAWAGYNTEGTGGGAGGSGSGRAEPLRPGTPGPGG